MEEESNERAVNFSPSELPVRLSNSPYSLIHQYESSNLEKFHIVCTDQNDPHLDLRIRFAISRHVKELILDSPSEIKVPKILFSYASLVKLHTDSCLFAPNEMVNWKNLEELKATHCKFLDRPIENILSACPLLESLNLSFGFFDRLTIASQSLRKLTLKGLQVRDDIAISCRNLEKLDLEALYAINNNARDDGINLSHPTVRYTTKGVLAVTSESLKKLHVKRLRIVHLEIWCPMLEELELYGSSSKTVKVVNLKPSAIVTLDIEDLSGTSMELLLQLQHVKELKFVRRFVDTWLALEGWETSNRPARSLSNKHLTLDYPCFNEIELALLDFDVLEKLVIKFPSRMWRSPIDFLELDDAEENYWSEAAYSNCLASHLEYVELIFLNTFYKHERVLNFIEFLLKKARVLKKMVIVFKNWDKSFATQVSKEVATFPRLSMDVVVEFSCSNMLC